MRPLVNIAGNDSISSLKRSVAVRCQEDLYNRGQASWAASLLYDHVRGSQIGLQRSQVRVEHCRRRLWTGTRMLGHAGDLRQQD